MGRMIRVTTRRDRWSRRSRLCGILAVVPAVGAIGYWAVGAIYGDINWRVVAIIGLVASSFMIFGVMCLYFAMGCEEQRRELFRKLEAGEV